MNSATHRKWNTGRRLVMAFICPALLLLLNAVCLAQTPTATPATVADPAKPEPVMLRVEKPDKTIDTAIANQVAKVRVGNTTPLDVKPDAQGVITFTPPANLSGAQQVQLLDSAGNPVKDSAGKTLGPISLAYPGGGGSLGQTNSNQTTTSTNVNTNTNVTGDDTNGASPLTGATPRIKVSGNEAEGPAWFVLVIFVGFFILALLALRTVPKVGAALTSKSFSTATVLIILLACALGVYFIGRAFGGNRTTEVLLPQPLVPASDTAAAGKPGAGATQQQQPAQTNPPGGQVTPPPPTPVPTPFPLSVSGLTVPDDSTGGLVAGLGDVVAVRVKNLKEELARQQKLAPDAAAGERLEPRKFVLFLDKIEIKKLYPLAVDPDRSELRFRLSRDADSRDAWLNFLARPESPFRPTSISVGPEGKPPLPGEQFFTLRLYYPRLLKLGVILFALTVIGFLLLAKNTSIIRDSGPPEPPQGAFRPYSLARSQVAWWFFLILGAFGFIWLVTGDLDTITNSSLVLLGIGTGTALGAAMIDANKRDTTDNDLLTLKPQQARLTEEVAQLEAQIADLEDRGALSPPVALTAAEQATLNSAKQELATKKAALEQVNKQVVNATSALDSPVSEGFKTDILSDVNGVTFHRFQIAVWTIVLGIIFARSVWEKLVMPEFSDTLLALMGISAGTYLGFKIPERQTGPGASVQGTVTKADGTPAPGATVVFSQSGAEKGKAACDAAGKYKLDVAAGDYDVVASLAGSAPSDTAKVKVTAGVAQTVNLKLK